MFVMYYNDNYADEFNVEGTICLSPSEYLAFSKAVNRFGADSFSIGSNQSIHYTQEEIYRAFSFRGIEEKEYEVLKKFNLHRTGLAHKFYDFVVENDGQVFEEEY